MSDGVMATAKAEKGSSLWKRIKQQKYLLIMAVLPVAWMLIFCYYPIYGIVVAFKDYNFGLGIMGSPWAGLKYFKELFGDPDIPRIIVNTFRISFLKLLFGFPAPIIFAVLLNELRGMKMYKKFVQTATYLPHFISWAFIAGYLSTLLTDDGAINSMLMSLGLTSQPIQFLAQKGTFIGVIVASDVWKSFGFSSIIYLAAITSVDVQLYEAATIDGATRFQQVWHITLPSIKPTIMILLIMSISGLMGSNFEQMYLMKNSLVNDVAEVLSTYTYTMGMIKGRFSYSTAADLFQSFVSVTLLLIANFTSKKLTDESFF